MMMTETTNCRTYTFVECIDKGRSYSVGIGDDAKIGTLNERHMYQPTTPITNIHDREQTLALALGGTDGVIMKLRRGLPTNDDIQFAQEVIATGRPLWFSWPGEGAVEKADADMLTTHRRILLYLTAIRVAGRFLSGLRMSPHYQQVQDHRVELRDLVPCARPVPLPKTTPPQRIAYFRLDYWNALTAGGSYGHTCYVAKELNDASGGKTVAFLANSYAMLNTFGVQQILLGRSSSTSNESDLFTANDYFLPRLKTAIEVMAPDFIYERICLGNYVGAKISHELRVPYVVEYNGSELAMSKSFDSAPRENEDMLRRAEEYAFHQASAISVVSRVVADQLMDRGVDPGKILVNPNGACTENYRPADAESRKELRAQFHWTHDEVVVGFVGTFGGWHGIATLAAALPVICGANARIRFLLIGDGANRRLVEDAVRTANLGDRVVMTGMLPQERAAELLRACDIYVSPHDSHMADSPFFGSPTKLFEYMALGGGIVASDLMQLGDVLRPALTPDDLQNPDIQAEDRRAVLCKPGDVAEFSAGVLGLAARQDLCRALGANARRAVLDRYSWKCHVKRLLAFLRGEAEDRWLLPEVMGGASPRVAILPAAPDNAIADHETLTEAMADDYKREVQKQWDNNSCGSQYVKDIAPHTLEWYLDVERYRYKEYAPWMPSVMGFKRYRGKRVLELGAGIGTDLAQFAANGALVTDLDLSSGHLMHAQENFQRRGLTGEFIQGDCENIPLPSDSFDAVYSNGVIHHTPNTKAVVDEIFRVLKPGGEAIIMVYAENSLHFWRNIVFHAWFKSGQWLNISVGECMSCVIELSANGAKPLVKLYTKPRLARLFSAFEKIEIEQRQLMRAELPWYLRWLPAGLAARFVGWNLVIKARKPMSGPLAAGHGG